MNHTVSPVTRLFDRDSEDEVGALEGVHPLPVGTVVLARTGTFLVEQVRLVFGASDASLWLDVRRAKQSGRGYVPEE